MSSSQIPAICTPIPSDRIFDRDSQNQRNSERDISDDSVRNLIKAVKDCDPSVTLKEIEEAIEVLHGDIRSIGRQIRQRKLRLEIDDSLGKDIAEAKENDGIWLRKVERVIENKFDQIRMLERALGDLRSGSINALSRSHLHVRIMKEIVLCVDDSLTHMEDVNLASFSKDDVEKLKKLVDDLEGMWPELFE